MGEEVEIVELLHKVTKHVFFDATEAVDPAALALAGHALLGDMARDQPDEAAHRALDRDDIAGVAGRQWTQVYARSGP